MSKKLTFELILKAAEKGVVSTFSKSGKAINAFNKTAKSSAQIMGSLERTIGGFIGAWVGISAIAKGNQMMEDASKAAYDMEASIRAARREFENIGSIQSWNAAISRLSDDLVVYSNTSLKAAVSRTIDMTKRLGLSREQMELLIARTGDLSAGKVELEGGIERVTAAIRGEAESAEYLGLTLNENYVKAWYQAHDAHAKAWKDLTDLEKAQVRFNVFLEQASPTAGRAAESANTYAGAIALVKKEVNNAVTENEDLVEAMNSLATVLRENSDEIGSLVAAIATGVAKTVEWSVQNKELIITLAKAGGIVWALGKVVAVISVFKSTLLGMDAVFTVFTGSRFVPWLLSANTALQTVAASAGLAGTAIRVALAGAAAYGAVQIARLAQEIYAWRKAVNEANAAEERAAKSKERLAEKLKKISDQTGVAIKSGYELNQAIKSGVIHLDKMTGTWKKGAGEMADAMRKSAEEQKNTVVQVTDEMKRKYQEFVDEVKRLQDEIAGRERSLQEELRAMARTGMSDLGAWRDRKKEADEYYIAAEQAASAGDFKEAVEYADKAKQAYKDLNKEVKSGDTVLVSQSKALKASMDGVRDAGELAIDILKKQQQAAEDAAAAMDKEVGGKLSGNLFDATTKAVQQTVTELDKVRDGVEEVGRDWGEVWQDMEREALQKLGKIKAEVRRLDGTTATIYIREEQKRQFGGLIHGFGGAFANGGLMNFLSGGHLPGYGGGDRRHILAEDGEVMLRKESVMAAGLRAALAFNAGRFDIVMQELLRKFDFGGMVKARVGGLISSLPSPVRMQTGGAVAASGAAAGEQDVHFYFPGFEPITGRFRRNQVRDLETNLSEYMRNRS